MLMEMLSAKDNNNVFSLPTLGSAAETIAYPGMNKTINNPKGAIQSGMVSYSILPALIPEMPNTRVTPAMIAVTNKSGDLWRI